MRDGWTGDQLGAALQADRAALDGAMFSVWLHGNWRHLTKIMTTEQREAAADAVEREHERDLADDPGMVWSEETQQHLRWWRL